MEQISKQWRERLPPTFPGKEIAARTDGQFNWETIQNKKFLGQIPRDCFIYSGRQVLIVRDPFLNWWIGTLSDKPPRTARAFKPRQRNSRISAL
jgi:hypothetical protein